MLVDRIQSPRRKPFGLLISMCQAELIDVTPSIVTICESSTLSYLMRRQEIWLISIRISLSSVVELCRL
jgi:hypothetical protein